MKLAIFTTILTLAFCLVAFTQDKDNLPTSIHLVQFDNFAKLSSKRERERFYLLFFHLSQNKDLKSLVVLKLNRNDSANKKIERLREISKYLNLEKADKTKITFAVVDAEKEQIIFWVEPEDVNLEDLLADETSYKLIRAEEFDKKISELFITK